MMWLVSVTCFHSWSILPQNSSCVSALRASEDLGPSPNCGTWEKPLNFLASIDLAVKMRHCLIPKVVLTEVHKYFKYFGHYKAVFICSLHTYLLSSYYAEGALLGTEDKGVSKKAKPFR